MEAALARGITPVFTAVQRRFGLRGWGWGGFFGDRGLWGKRRGCIGIKMCVILLSLQDRNFP